MKSDKAQILGKVPNQSCLDYIRENTGVFPGFGMTVIVADQGVALPSGEHTHSAYEFILPFCEIVASIKGKAVTIPKHTIFPINSEQSHGLVNEAVNLKLSSIEIDKDYLCGLSRTVYGNPDIVFDNECYELENSLMLHLRAFIQECKYRQAGHELAIKGLQYQIAVGLMRYMGNNMQSIADKIHDHEKASVMSVIEYMRDHADHAFDLDVLARIADLSKYHFIRVFKAQTGKTPNEYHTYLKIEKAMKMIRQDKGSITDICYECGFSDPSHFAHLFKKHVGVKPTDFRKMSKDNTLPS